MLLRESLANRAAAGSIAIVCVSILSAACRADALEPAAFIGLARSCGPTVAASTLAAVAKTESGFEPLTIFDNTSGNSHVYPTFEVAASAVERLIAGGHSVDIGLMQINSANLKRLGMTAREALEPCKSIQGAASILTRAYLDARETGTEQTALRDAISAYNTGNRTAGYRNGYVRKVEQAAAALLPRPVPSPALADGAVVVTAAEAAGASPPANSWDVWKSQEQPATAATAAAVTPSSINVF